MNFIFRPISQRVARYKFNKIASRVLQTPPLQMLGDDPIIISMLCKQDIYMYLLAIKSLYTRLGVGKVMIINDGSLQKKDRALIDYHVPHSDIIDLKNVDTGRCPRGGTWERLVEIIRQSEKRYVIQLDADTLTIGQIKEVSTNVLENKPFLLGTQEYPKILSADKIGTIMTNSRNNHISCVSEAALSRLPNASALKYARASSGFSGFARGAFNFCDLENFSDQMHNYVGSRWYEWGTEQVASNFVLANAVSATVLPTEKYVCFWGNATSDDVRFLHFIGTHRYDGGVYRKEVHRLLRGF